MQFGTKQVTLRSRFLAVRLPVGGFIWNYPAAVLVEENGLVEELPIVDMTRLSILVLAGLSTAVTFLSLLKRK